MIDTRLPATLATVCGLLVLASACGGGGGGGDDGGGGGVTPPFDSGALPPTVGLVSAAADDGSVRVVWRAVDADGAPVAVALFGDPSPGAVYSGVPLAFGAGDGDFIVSGLTSGLRHHFGLAIDEGGGSYTPTGAVLAARPNPPFFVDAASTASSPDGLTPATAFTEPEDGVLAASGAGGGNVWIAAGDYADVALQPPAGVDLYGGFDSGLTLAGRDPAMNVTRLIGQDGAPLVELSGGGVGAVLDGLTLEGADASTLGVDLDGTPAELRALDVSGFTGDGVRARSSSTSSVLALSLTGCRLSGNGAAGLSAQGAFDLAVHNARFSVNRAEGLALAGLVAHEGLSVALTMRDSTCFGNGDEGLDCDLVPPPVTGPGGGTWTVTIERSSFDRNGEQAAAGSDAGLDLDAGIGAVPGLEARLALRGLEARGNAGPGVRLDLDATAATIVHRLHSAGNGADGLLVASGTTAGLALVSSSACFGNQGYGVRATGGKLPVLVSHSVLAGNRLGGLASETVESAMVSSVGWLQPLLATGSFEAFGVDAGDPLLPPFQRVPVEFQRVASFISGALQVEDATTLMVGDTVAVGGDGVERTIVGFSSGHSVFVTPAPESVPLPTSFTRFPSAGPVEPDLTLAAGSPAAGAAMPDPVLGAVDAGVFGAPLGGEPGGEELTPAPLWFPVHVSPAPGSALGATDVISISFSDPLDATSVSQLSVRVVGPLGIVPTATSVFGDGHLELNPPGTWPSGELRLELHSGLSSTGGDPLATPLAIRFTGP